MGAPLAPYHQRRLDEVAAGNAESQARLVAAVGRMSHLTDDERAEGERLISLPYGAESFGLRRFILDHFCAVAA